MKRESDNLRIQFEVNAESSPKVEKQVCINVEVCVCLF